MTTLLNEDSPQLIAQEVITMTWKLACSIIVRESQSIEDKLIGSSYHLDVILRLCEARHVF